MLNKIIRTFLILGVNIAAVLNCFFLGLLTASPILCLAVSVLDFNKINRMDLISGRFILLWILLSLPFCVIYTVIIFKNIKLKK